MVVEMPLALGTTTVPWSLAVPQPNWENPPGKTFLKQTESPPQLNTYGFTTVCGPLFASTHPVKTPAVQAVSPLGQHPTTLASVSSTQWDPALHVAGRSDDPSMYPHIVLSCRRRRAKRSRGGGVGVRGHDTTAVRAWNGNVVVGASVRLGNCCKTCALVRSRMLDTRRRTVGGGRR